MRLWGQQGVCCSKTSDYVLHGTGIFGNKISLPFIFNYSGVRYLSLTHSGP